LDELLVADVLCCRMSILPLYAVSLTAGSQPTWKTFTLVREISSIATNLENLHIGQGN